MAEKVVSSRNAILAAALREFAARGFAGARVEAIARSAGINKAMLFYYFSSKEGLYQAVLQGVMAEFFKKVQGLITPLLTPGEFLERFPRLYIELCASNPDFVRLVGFDLIQNPDNICAVMAGIIARMSEFKPHPLFEVIRRWHAEGQISEADPVQFMMNVVALSIFSFIGRPMVEAISGMRVADDGDFYARRVASVVNVLKRGMLK